MLKARVTIYNSQGASQGIFETCRILPSLCPTFSTIAEAITKLTKSRHPYRIKWTNDCKVAFCKLKEILVALSVLKVIKSDKPYIDTSELGFGAGPNEGQQSHNRNVEPLFVKSLQVFYGRENEEC